jgi:hypothetical protein
MTDKVFKLLCAGVKCCGRVLNVLAFTGQRIGSWGSWLTCETRPVHEVGFIRKERLQLQQCSGAQKLVAPCSGEGWGFLWMLYLWVRVRVRWVLIIGCGFARAGSLTRAGLFAPYWGRGNNLESILFISPMADLWDPVSPPQGAGMQIYNSSRCRAHSALHGGWDTHSSVTLLVPRPNKMFLIQNQVCLLKFEEL